VAERTRVVLGRHIVAGPGTGPGDAVAVVAVVAVVVVVAMVVVVLVVLVVVAVMVLGQQMPVRDTKDTIRSPVGNG